MRRWFPAALLLLAAPLFAAPNGAALFAENCSACHGLDGMGGVGTPLALDSFLSTVSDDYLVKTIRHGRPGRIMPAFQTLSNSQVKAIVHHVRSWSDSEPPEEEYTPIQGDVGHGELVFQEYCAICHGDNGQGGHGTGVTFSRKRDLPIIPPALNNEGFLAAASNRMIKATVTNGRAGTPMDAYGRILSEKDIDDVTAFIRSFETRHATREQSAEPIPFIIKMKSEYDLETTADNVRQAAIGANFVVIRTDHLEYGLVPEGEEDPRQIFVDFCNFNFLFEALKIDPRIGMFLPCRVSVVEEDDGVYVMVANPMALAKLFNNNELNEACKTQYRMYETILEEATL